MHENNGMSYFNLCGETKAICKCKVILRVKVKNLVNYCIDVSFTFQ